MKMLNIDTLKNDFINLLVQKFISKLNLSKILRTGHKIQTKVERGKLMKQLSTMHTWTNSRSLDSQVQ